MKSIFAKICFVFICIPIVAFTFLQKQPLPKTLYTLVGKWQMKTEKQTYFEQWGITKNNTLFGKTYKIKKGANDTVFLEKITLQFKNGIVNYTPTTLGQNNGNPINFKLTSSTQNQFVFTNMQHDFPKRIVYDFINKDSIHAWVDDATDNLDNQLHFYYNRVKK